MKTNYFDYNATTPLDPQVWEAMRPFFQEHFGNPSSAHQLGNISKNAIKKARRQVAALIGADESEIIFTSGGTESNQTAIRSALAAFPDRREVVTSKVEHSSILKMVLQLEKEGYLVHRVGVDSSGQLKLSELLKVISDRTAIVSLMMANNETGVIFPFEEVGQILKSRQILFHIDAVQAVGKFPFSVRYFHADYLSLAAHKFYGPKGIGALYVRDKALYQPLILGGSQERSRRAGTENVPGIVGMGSAAARALDQLDSEVPRLEGLRRDFEKEMCEKLSGVSVNGIASKRLCNTSSLCFSGVEAESLLMVLDQKGFFVSSGSACMSGAQDPSHVLKAMGFSDAEAKASLRFSLGYLTTREQVQNLTQTVIPAVQTIRDLAARKSEPKKAVMI